ncbi:MAG: FtsW/RodA/SpoVE family cell cycle protein [Lachnospiraceae bacterium]
MLFVFLLYRLFFIAQNAPIFWGADRDWYFCPGRSAGDPEYCRCAQCDSGHGITLPFISYGGTSIVFLMAEMGIALSVADKIRLKDEYTL